MRKTSDSTGMTEMAIRRGCTPCGDYKCQVPMALRGRRQDIDICIADIVAALNAANIVTTASCCGHGGTAGDGCILLEDGRELKVDFTNWYLRNEVQDAGDSKEAR